MILKKRKAVGGLISLIGLIVVFGIASIAYLELSSSQTGLINTSFSMSQKTFDKNNERLNFTKIAAGSSEDYLYDVENLGSKTITINSHVTKTANSFAGKAIIDIPISPVSTKNIGINVTSIDPTNVIIFVTDSGKKCLVPVGVSFRLC